jgi:hypothetical protein
VVLRHGIVHAADAGERVAERLADLGGLERCIAERTAIEVARGSRDANALKAALDNPSAQESDVYFILRSVDPKGKEFDVGQAYLNLRKLVDEQRDVVRAPTPLLDPRGQSLGQLTLSIFALDAIREATGEARRAGASAGSSDAKSPSKSASKFASSLEPSATSPPRSSNCPMRARSVRLMRRPPCGEKMVPLLPGRYAASSQPARLLTGQAARWPCRSSTCARHGPAASHAVSSRPLRYRTAARATAASDAPCQLYPASIFNGASASRVISRSKRSPVAASITDAMMP